MLGKQFSDFRSLDYYYVFWIYFVICIYISCISDLVLRSHEKEEKEKKERMIKKRQVLSASLGPFEVTKLSNLGPFEVTFPCL